MHGNYVQGPFIPVEWTETLIFVQLQVNTGGWQHCNVAYSTDFY